MFDLEKQIEEWRREMQAAGIKTPVPLDELESHLRDEVEQQMRSGLGAEAAFEIAAQRIGQGGALKAEFTRTCFSIEMRLGELMGIACVAIACMFSLWLVGALVTAHEPSLIERLLGLTAVATIVLSCQYGHRFLPVIRNPRIRTVIGAGCCLACVAGMRLFMHFLPRFIVLPAGKEIPVGQFLTSFIWTWTAIAILGGVAYGLEKAARKKIATAGA